MLQQRSCTTPAASARSSRWTCSSTRMRAAATCASTREGRRIAPAEPGQHRPPRSQSAGHGRARRARRLPIDLRARVAETAVRPIPRRPALPVRATLACQFWEFSFRPMKLQRNERSSPDHTKSYVVKEGTPSADRRDLHRDPRLWRRSRSATRSTTRACCRPARCSPFRRSRDERCPIERARAPDPHQWRSHPGGVGRGRPGRVRLPVRRGGRPLRGAGQRARREQQPA